MSDLYEPGDRVCLDMPGDPYDGRIGVIEVSHPVYIDKPWQCVRIAEQLVNLPEVLLRPMEGGDAQWTDRGPSRGC